MVIKIFFNLLDQDEDYPLDSEEIADNFKSIFHTDPNEASSMFYSMMSESSINSDHMSHMNNSRISTKDSECDSNEYSNEVDDDKNQILFSKNLKQTIEQLQTDAIKQSSNLASNQHNLFQTFKITFRQFSLTVLHHDPQQTSETQKTPKLNSIFQFNLTKRLIVERMKPISDSYFDWVSTIDTHTNVSQGSTSTSRIEKSTVLKYHQACAFNDHFLLLVKPINLSLIQKINQRNLQNNSSSKSSTIHYSLNDATLTIGYIQIDEYLVPSENATSDLKTKQNDKNSRRFKNLQAIETSQLATITEILYFTDSNPTVAQIEQPCIKAQLVFYDPIEQTGQKPRQIPKYTSNSEQYLLNRCFENIVIQLNQSLVLELDISIIDRLYYIINDISKIPSAPNNQPTQNTSSNKILNFEIKCSQQMKLGLRFPIADLRRAQQPKTFFTKSSEMTSSSLTLNSLGSQAAPLLKPVTMIAFRTLREQILTLHLFDLTFQTLSNAPFQPSDCSDLLLTITSSQINAYYQYNKKERPIHFGLIQQKPNEPRSLLFSIKIPIENGTNLIDESSQLLNDELFNLNSLDTQTLTEIDSLKQIYNINISKANRFAQRTNQPIKEESEAENTDETTNAQEYDEDDEDNDASYGPFSKIHTLISSEKNRRIVNAGNKTEMNTFIAESKANSQMVIKLFCPS